MSSPDTTRRVWAVMKAGKEAPDPKTGRYPLWVWATRNELTSIMEACGVEFQTPSSIGLTSICESCDFVLPAGTFALMAYLYTLETPHG